MKRPDDALAPRESAFDEPWQVQVLAMADACVAAGQFSAGDWATALGAALARAEAAGRPDDNATYYAAALEALEGLAASAGGISAEAQAQRKADWREAYLATPHGQPVMLKGDSGT